MTDDLEKLSPQVTSASVEAMLSTIRACQQSMRMAKEELSYCDGKTQDILHEMELCALSYHERGKRAGELTEVRRRRRAAKNIIEQCAPLDEWATPQTVGALQRCLGEMRRIEERQRNRVYIPRTESAKQL